MAVPILLAHLRQNIHCQVTYRILVTSICIVTVLCFFVFFLFFFLTNINSIHSIAKYSGTRLLLGERSLSKKTNYIFIFGQAPLLIPFYSTPSVTIAKPPITVISNLIMHNDIIVVFVPG